MRSPFAALPSLCPPYASSRPRGISGPVSSVLDVRADFFYGDWTLFFPGAAEPWPSGNPCRVPSYWARAGEGAPSANGVGLSTPCRRERIDPGDRRFCPHRVGVVHVWKDFASRGGALSSPDCAGSTNPSSSAISRWELDFSTLQGGSYDPEGRPEIVYYRWGPTLSGCCGNPRTPANK